MQDFPNEGALWILSCPMQKVALYSETAWDLRPRRHAGGNNDEHRRGIEQKADDALIVSNMAILGTPIGGLRHWGVGVIFLSILVVGSTADSEI